MKVMQKIRRVLKAAMAERARQVIQHEEIEKYDHLYIDYLNQLTNDEEKKGKKESV
ncbi:hypothetical protein [Pradoshia sp.]|uniref:hypothetical protein n=1 Tax=Pradoshia sp. TaxID=2651281 RepID=UPI003F03F06E